MINFPLQCVTLLGCFGVTLTLYFLSSNSVQKVFSIFHKLFVLLDV